jgi:Sec-independent protein translocase protein TatA
MDTLCGIGLPELIILALLGFVVIGPERSREVALQLGRWLRTVMQSPWWQEFNQITDSIRNLPTTLVRMAELEETQQELQRAMNDIERDARIDVNRRPAPESGAPATGQPSDDPWGIQTQQSTSPAGSKPPPAPPAPEAPDTGDAPPGDDGESPSGDRNANGGEESAT